MLYIYNNNNIYSLKSCIYIFIEYNTNKGYKWNISYYVGIYIYIYLYKYYILQVAGDSHRSNTASSTTTYSGHPMTNNDDPRLGKYRLIKTIGKGNFAKVKLAKHIPTNREVILNSFYICIYKYSKSFNDLKIKIQYIIHFIYI